MMVKVREKMERRLEGKPEETGKRKDRGWIEEEKIKKKERKRTVSSRYKDGMNG